MNITCDQCGKRYKMKAEQTKKAFKTRCKRCSNVIIVRPEEHQEAEGSAQESPPTATQEQAQWYAVVDGQQSGPFTVAQVAEFLSSGSLDEQSFVWCEGMSNWEPISGVPQLRDLIHKSATPAPVTSAPVMSATASAAAVTDEPQVRTSPAVEEARNTPQPALSMGIQIGHNRDLLASVASKTPETEQVFASSQASESSNVMFGSSESQQFAQLTNQRNENSVLFSLDSIDSMGTQGVKVHNGPTHESDSRTLGTPLITNTGGSEGSGLIDLAALSSLTSGGGPGGAQPAPINLTAGVKKVGGRSLTTKSNDFKTIALAVSSTALVAILGFIGYQNFLVPPPPPPAPVSLGTTTSTPQTTVGTTNSVVVTQPSTEAVTSVVSQTNSDLQPATTPAQPEESALAKPKQKVRSSSKRSRAPRSSSRSSKSSPSSKRKESNANNNRSSSSASAKAAPKSKKSEATALLSNLKGGRNSSRSGGDALGAITGGSKPKASGPKKPSKDAIMSAMKKVNLNGCLSREPSLKGKGSIKVRVVAVSSGAIKTAQVQNSPYKSSPIGACLEREVRRQRFPSFTDPEISFTFPFKN